MSGAIVGGTVAPSQDGSGGTSRHGDPSSGGVSKRIYREDDIQLECEGKYDQEKVHQGFVDDEYGLDYPHRYLTNWSVKVATHRLPRLHAGDAVGNNSGNTNWTCIPLPESDEFLPTMGGDTYEEALLQHDAAAAAAAAADKSKNSNQQEDEPTYYQYAILEGELLPNAHYPHLPRLRVSIDHLRNVCLDVMAPHRGYWIATTATTPHAAYYYLQAPSAQQELLMLQRRAQLGVVSNRLDFIGGQLSICDDQGRHRHACPQNWHQKAPLALHKEWVEQAAAQSGSNKNRMLAEPFSLELVRQFGPHLQRHLLQVAALSPRCTFYQHLGKHHGRPKRMAWSQLEQLCSQAESRSQQHSWGGSCAVDASSGPSLLELAIQQDLPKRYQCPKRGPDSKCVPDWDLIASVAKRFKAEDLATKGVTSESVIGKASSAVESRVSDVSVSRPLLPPPPPVTDAQPPPASAIKTNVGAKSVSLAPLLPTATAQPAAKELQVPSNKTLGESSVSGVSVGQRPEAEKPLQGPTNLGESSGSVVLPVLPAATAPAAEKTAVGEIAASASSAAGREAAARPPA